MARARVDLRGRQVFQYLVAHKGDGFTLNELCDALGLEPSATTRRAIKYAAKMAKTEGLALPNACPSNGQTYRITDDVRDAYPPARHLNRVARGVDATNEDRNISFIVAEDDGAAQALEALRTAQQAIATLGDQVLSLASRAPEDEQS